MRIAIVGGGVAGSEAGTYLGSKATKPIEIIEIESNPNRKFGGWAFQSFPNTECTNLAMRKMYLGDNPEEIFEWARTADRSRWPAKQDFEFDPDQPFPRVLMREYVKWRRNRVNNGKANYSVVYGQAMQVSTTENRDGLGIHVKLDNGRYVDCDRLLMASGSITVKVPTYLSLVLDDDRVIIDPLTLEGHERRARIPQDAKVLVLGTGLTGEEQINVLLKSNHSDLTLFSRGGMQHYRYQEKQTNIPLVLDKAPDFFMAETPEEFNTQLTEFYGKYLSQGHSPEDVIDAIRPFWEQLRFQLGGCVKAAARLREFKRTLAVNSIGTSYEVGENLKKAQEEGKFSVLHGEIEKVTSVEFDKLEVTFKEDTEVSCKHRFIVRNYDYIINAVGRNIIRHPIWDGLIADGFARKHAGIGVQVGVTGRMLNADGNESDCMWVVGMPRSGDHALRRGYLGNTAFNVPQVRSHIYGTMDDLLSTI